MANRKDNQENKRKREVYESKVKVKEEEDDDDDDEVELIEDEEDEEEEESKDKPKEYVAGIDEVARGCVLGSLFAVCYVVSTDKEKVLERKNVRDSKVYKGNSGKNKRLKLSQELTELADQVIVKELTAQEISRNGEGSLNKVVYQLFMNAISEIKLEFMPKKIYIDACGDPDHMNDYFSQRLERLRNGGLEPPQVISEPKADDKYRVVSAASIVAKERREAWVKEMNDSGHTFGSGYPGDSKTIKWLTDEYEKNGQFPSFTRTYWSTCQRIKDSLEKKKKENQSSKD